MPCNNIDCQFNGPVTITLKLNKINFVIAVSVCDSNPCSNDGLCHEKGDKYQSTCDPGFSGDQCDGQLYISSIKSLSILLYADVFY